MKRSPWVLVAVLVAVVAVAGMVAAHYPNREQEAVAAGLELRGVRDVRVLQVQQWDGRAVALYVGRNGAEPEVGVAYLSRALGMRWAMETSSNSIGQPPHRAVEMSCGSGGDRWGTYTAVYGVALRRSVTSVSALLGSVRREAIVGVDGSFLLATPRAVVVRHVVVRDRRGDVIWQVARMCSDLPPASKSS